AAYPVSDSSTGLRGLLRISLHWDVEVTDTDIDTERDPQPPAGAGRDAGPLVSQAFCSALPVAYSDMPAPQWAGFVTLVLEAT
ncbi:MAG TPA: hypothetical protein VK876_02190, partial [Rubrivivax sp.]|nr:hypothetical protein [Rubrivivax sp.]